MKNKILISILSIGLFVGSSALAREAETIPAGVNAPFGLSRINMVQDGTFDNGIDVFTFGGNGANSGEFKSSIVGGDPDGGKCLLLSIANDGPVANSIQGRVTTSLESFTAGDTYIYSFWSKVDKVDKYTIEVWLRSATESKVISNDRHKIELVGDGKWHYYAVPFVPTEDGKQAGVVTWLGAQGKKNFEIYFDDVKVRAVSKVEPWSIPEFEATEIVSFEDIGGHWAEKEIREMAAMGIIKGRDELTFGPEAPVTRAEMVALLARGIGYGPTTQKNPFFDSNPTDWYAKELDIVAEAGVIDSGMLWHGNFFGDKELKRQELAMFMANSYDVMINTTTFDFDIRYLTDRNEIDDWAIVYIMRSVRLGLMEGVEWNVFAPQGTVTRAQAATAICRLRNMISAVLQ